MNRTPLAFIAALSVMVAASACSAPANADGTIPAGSDLGKVIKSAKAGQVLLLAPGAYPPFSLQGVNFATPVIVKSADPTHPAQLGPFQMTGGGGVTFREVELITPPGPGSYNFLFQDCHDVAIERVNVHGSLDGNPQNDQSGIAFFGVTNFSIVDSDFRELLRALGGGPSQNPAFKKAPIKNLVIARNKLSLLQVTGMMLSAVDGGQIVNNSLSNFQSRMTGDVTSDHPDGIQFLTGTNGNTLAPSRNVTISSNLIYRGAGNVGMQGIFVTDEQGDLPPTGIVVTDNLLIYTGYNGITGNNWKASRVENNVLWSSPAQKTWIGILKSDGLSLRNNAAVIVQSDGSVNVTNSGNTVNGPLDPAKVPGVIAAWRTKHPEVPN